VSAEQAKNLTPDVEILRGVYPEWRFFDKLRFFDRLRMSGTLGSASSTGSE
jgi:hypothetical protein